MYMTAVCINAVYMTMIYKTAVFLATVSAFYENALNFNLQDC